MSRDRIIRAVVLAGAAATALSACSDKEFSLPWEPAGGRANLAGPAQMLEPNIEAFDNNQLASLLDPAEFRANKSLIKTMSARGIIKTSEVLKAEKELEAAKKQLEAEEKAVTEAEAAVASAITESGMSDYFDMLKKFRKDLKDVDIQLLDAERDLKFWNAGFDPQNSQRKPDEATRLKKIAELDKLIKDKTRVHNDLRMGVETLVPFIEDNTPKVTAAKDLKIAAEGKVEDAKEKVAAASQKLADAQNGSSGNLAGQADGNSIDLRPEDEKTQLEFLTKAMFVSNRYGDAANHRNRIQDRLLLASQQRCNFFKDYLRRIDAYKSFGLGSLTTILGGASAIVTGEAAARILGGSAGIVSGVHAEFNQAFFQNLAIHVITPAIEIRRNKTLRTIRLRQRRTIDQYTVQSALHDALRYHNECSINAGFEEAADSIKTVKDPGLRASTETVERITKLRRAVDAMTGVKRVDVFNLDEMPTSVLVQVKAKRDKRINTVEALVKRVEAMTATSVADQLASITGGFNTDKGKLNEVLEDTQNPAQKASNDAIEAHEALKVAEAADDDVALTQDFAAKNFAAQELSAKYRHALAEFEKKADAVEEKLKKLLDDARSELLQSVGTKLTTTALQKAFIDNLGITAEEGKEIEAITLTVSTARFEKLKEINDFFKNLETPGADDLTADKALREAILAAFEEESADKLPDLVFELQIIMGYEKPDGDLGRFTKDEINKAFPKGLTKATLLETIQTLNASGEVTGEKEAPHDTTKFEAELKPGGKGEEALAKLNKALKLTAPGLIEDFNTAKGNVDIHKGIIELRTSIVKKPMAASGFVTEYLIENLPTEPTQ